MKLEYTDSTVKKMFWAQRLIKKVMPTILDMKGAITIDFIEKGQL